ncbi:MAG: hypothetical protein AB7F25_02630 [Deferribacterales bacterium]
MKKNSFYTKLENTLFEKIDPQLTLTITSVMGLAPVVYYMPEHNNIPLIAYSFVMLGLTMAGVTLGIAKDNKEIDKLWSEHRRKRGKVQGKYGDRIKELIHNTNSAGVRDHKIGAEDIAWQLETRTFRTEDILENYELPSLVEIHKLSELFFWRTFKLDANISEFPEEEGNRIILCNMLFIITGDERYLSEDCRPESSVVRKVFEDYEAVYNAECYELLESYERSLT